MFTETFPFLSPAALFLLAAGCARFAVMSFFQYAVYTKAADKTRVFRIETSKRQYERELSTLGNSFVVDGLLVALLFNYDVITLANTSLLTAVFQFVLQFVVTEVISYFVHRVAHHVPSLFDTFHSKHHQSVLVQPTTGLVHDALGRMSHLAVFWGVIAAVAYVTGGLSWVTLYTMVLTCDFLTTLIHSNTELFPCICNKAPFNSILITPSYHALHHARVHGNYGQFTPWMDILLGTKFSDTDGVFELSSEGVGLHRITETATGVTSAV